MRTIKLIDLLIDMANYRELPKKIKWGVHYFTLCVDGYKAFDEPGSPNIFEIAGLCNSYLLNEEVEIIEDVPKKLIQVSIVSSQPKEDEKIVSLLPDPLEIEKDEINYFIRNEHGTKCYLTTNNRITIEKLNQIIECLKRMSK